MDLILPLSAGQVARVAADDLPSLTADKGYDWMQLREKRREKGMRPLIKHREFRPVDHAHDARIDRNEMALLRFSGRDIFLRDVLHRELYISNRLNSGYYSHPEVSAPARGVV
jgi:IS5 family transposase